MGGGHELDGRSVPLSSLGESGEQRNPAQSCPIRSPELGHCVGTYLFFTSKGLPFMTGGWDGGHPKPHPGLCTRATLSGRGRGACGRWQGYKSQKGL